MKKWNVVYTMEVAGTVSQEKIDEYRKAVTDNPDCFMGIYDIVLRPDSPDEDYAKYLFLSHETLEEETLDIELEEVGRCD